MKCFRVSLVGSSCLDVHLKCQVELVRDNGGVRLYDPETDFRTLITTDRKPYADRNITTIRPISLEEMAIFADRVIPGGGAVNAGASLARLAKRLGLPTEVRIPDSSVVSPELERLCTSEAIRLVSLGRHDCPVNLVCGNGHEGTIVRSPAPDQYRRRLSSVDTEVVASATKDIDAIALMSPVDAALAHAAFDAAKNGTALYFQPSGSLPAGDTLALSHRATALACNFQELRLLARKAGLDHNKRVDESSTDAPRVARQTLLDLFRQGVIPVCEAAACTLGRYGSVVLDFQRRRSYQISIELLNETAGAPSIRGCGDTWFAHWLVYRETWGNRGHLRDPEGCCAMRASHDVATLLGLRRGDYLVDVTATILDRLEKIRESSPVERHRAVAEPVPAVV